MKYYLVVIVLVSVFIPSKAAEYVNVYSFRKAELIEPLIEEFRRHTGINVNVVYGKADILMERLLSDGKNTNADVLLTVDVARLEAAKASGLTQKIQSSVVIDNVRDSLRDSDGYWVGLSMRGRAIFYSKERVSPADVQQYSDLTSEKFKGRLCTRAGEHFYNRSMLASFIAVKGRQWSEKWLSGIVSNLATRAGGKDREQLYKIAQGKCDVTVVNTYYYGLLAESKQQFERLTYEKVGIMLPDGNGDGMHMNISGAAIVNHSKNKQNAIRFIEFLTTKVAQRIYANSNHEYPIRNDVKMSQLLSSWGLFKPDEKSLTRLYQYHDEAQKLIQKYAW